MTMRTWGLLICCAALCSQAAGQTTQPATQPALTPPGQVSSDERPPTDEWRQIYVWSKQFGSERADYIDQLAVDADGNLYVVGSTDGAIVEPSAGGPDGYLIKFDPDGNELWRRQIGSEGHDFLSAVTVGADGMVYAAGVSEGDFLGENQGKGDLFVTTCDLDGNEMWTVSLGGPQSEWAETIAVDAHGGIFVALRAGLQGFRGGDSAILVKLDASSHELWRQTITRHHPLEDVQLTPDGNGGCVVTGGGMSDDGDGVAFMVFLDSDGVETEHITHSLGQGRTSHNSTRDAAGNTYFTGRQEGTPRRSFVVKLSPTGERLWLSDVIIPGASNHDGGPQAGTASCNLVVDAAGNVYVTGKIDTRPGGADTFVAVYDPQGQLRCGWNLGPDVGTLAWELMLRPDGVLIISGETTGAHAGERQGALDVFLIAYRFVPLTVESSPQDQPAEVETNGEDVD